MLINCLRKRDGLHFFLSGVSFLAPLEHPSTESLRRHQKKTSPKSVNGENPTAVIRTQRVALLFASPEFMPCRAFVQLCVVNDRCRRISGRDAMIRIFRASRLVRVISRLEIYSIFLVRCVTLHDRNVASGYPSVYFRVTRRRRRYVTNPSTC
jgi:hypothetical protein